MDSSSEWRSALGFSERMATVMKISSAYQDAQPSLTSTDARRQSTATENQAYSSAESIADYSHRCQKKIEELLEQASKAATTADGDDNGLNPNPVPGGVDIGKYRNAVHFADGLFSTVYKVDSPSAAPTGEAVALKVTVPSQMQPPHNSKREVRILEKAKFVNVIPLLESVHEPGGRLILVLPFMSNDLDQLLLKGVLSKTSTKECLRDLFKALQYIHSQGIIHRDIKPSNILMRSISGPAYLSDFGIAWMPNDPESEPADAKITDVGTTCYRPPELMFGNQKYGRSLDLWAAGCTLAEVFDPKHRTLFDSGELGSELALIQSMFKKLGTPNLSIWPEAANFPDWGKMEFYEYSQKPWSELLPEASQSQCDLVSKLVQYESGARLTAAEALEHSYFIE